MDKFAFQKDFRMINLMPYATHQPWCRYLRIIYPQILKVMKNQMGAIGALNSENLFVEGQPKGLGRVKIHLKHQSALFITRKTKIRNLLEIHNT